MSKKGAMTVEKLVEQGNTALASMQPELALKFFERAHGMSPEDTNVMDALADVHLQLGAMDAALALLTASTALAPDVNPFKWLYLAQLQHGAESAATYLKGIAALDKAAAAAAAVAASGEQTLLYRKQTAKAYSSLAELYLTDLCFEDDAEAKCEGYVAQALAADPETLDGQHALANLRLSQSRPAEAAEVIGKVYAKVKAARDKVSSRTVIEELMKVDTPAAGANGGDGDGDDDDDVPEPEFCIATAKYMVECAAAVPELAQQAMDLVTDLLHDDDDNIELWYIMGVAALSCRPPDTDAARYHLETAKNMMETLLENNGGSSSSSSSSSSSGGGGQDDFPYQEEYNLVLEHLRILDESGGNQDGTNLVAMGQDDEEWSDDDDDP
jgi:tetratricopeptide (TPR) repeat protein